MADTLLKQAMAEHERGHFLEAKRLYTMVVVQEPKNHLANYHLALLEFQLNEKEKAIHLMERAVRETRDNTTYWADLGFMYEASGRLEEAEIAYNEAIGLAPDVIQHYLSLGQLMVAQNRLSEAIKPFESIQKLQPENNDVYEVLYHLYYELGLADSFCRTYPDRVPQI